MAPLDTQGNQRQDLWFSVWKAMAEDAADLGAEPAPEVTRRLQSMPGRRLPPALTGAARSALGSNVDDVRLHAGPQADKVLALLGAPACCLGRHVLLSGRALGHGATAAGMLLHELAHVAGGRRGDVVRCWDAADHGALSVAACTAQRTLLEAIAGAVGMSWPQFLRGIRNAASNMDFRGRAARLGATASYVLGISKGEGVAHGESTNYTSPSMAANERLNVFEQNRHVNMAVGELMRDVPLLTIGSVSVRTPTGRSGSMGRTVGGVSLLERAWMRSLGNAFHVAQDRGSHREGTQGFGHDDPRCTGWSPDVKVHEHSMGKGWERCGEAAYNRALNNSLDIASNFLLGIKRRTRAAFTIPVPPRMPLSCP